MSASSPVRLAALAAWLATCAAGLLAPALAPAQTTGGTVDGIVRDASGSRLPDVTVEAASPSLIEGARKAVTDESGRYQLINLSPGIYTITYTRAGFATAERANLAVDGGVQTVDVTLDVGGLVERIVVGRAAPAVDLRSVGSEIHLSGELASHLPVTRAYGNLIGVVTGLTSSNPGSTVPAMTFFRRHGGAGNEGVVEIDGLNVGGTFNGSGVSTFLYDTVGAAELQLVLTGLGESDRGGPRLNIVPRSGGNAFSGALFGSIAGERFQGSNLTDELRAFGIDRAPALIRNWDASAALGGPLVRDRLWFYGSGRHVGEHRDRPGQYANRNAGDPARWDYVEDRSLKARYASSRAATSLRLTLNAGGGRISGYVDRQQTCDGGSLLPASDECRDRGDDWVAVNGGPGTSPEAGYLASDVEQIAQVTWQAARNDLLLEAGLSSFGATWSPRSPAGASDDLVPVIELDTPGDVPVPGFAYRGFVPIPTVENVHTTWRASVTRARGVHALTAGYQGSHQIWRERPWPASANLLYFFADGAPRAFETLLPGIEKSNRVRVDALFVQDQWVLGRATLQGALRYDHAWSWYPEGENGVTVSSPFVPVPFTLRGAPVVRGYHDLTPRAGLVYDLFGTGRTAAKVQFGRYLQGASNDDAYVAGNPLAGFARSVRRAWLDTNGNVEPDCDLTDGTLQSELPAGDFCGPWENQAFGDIGTATRVNPAVLGGWGVRPYDWQLALGLQHQVADGVIAEIGYHRRSWANFLVTDNRANDAGDWDAYTIVSPAHPRLDTSGQPVTFVTIRPEAFGLVDHYVTHASDYGDVTAYWQGIDTTVHARLAGGLTVQAGTSSGAGVRRMCEVTAALPELLGDRQVASCDVSEPWSTNVQGLTSYLVPAIDLRVSGVFRSVAVPYPQVSDGGRRVDAVATNGQSLAARYSLDTAQVAALLGRPLAGGAPFTTVDLTRPGQLYGDRLTALDLRLAKILRIGTTQTRLGLDVYNLLNAGTVTRYNEEFGADGATWLRPAAVMEPRFARLNVTIDF